MSCAGAAELVEAEAWAQMQSARHPDARATLGITVHRHDGAASIAARHCAELAVNRVFALGVRSPATRDLVDTIMREYREDDIARFIVQVTPVTQPAALREWLTACGFVRAGALVKLCRATDDIPRVASGGDVRVAEIDAAEREVFEEIVGAPLQVPAPMRPGLSATLGMTGWRYYLAYRGERAIAGAALYCDGTVGWCGLAATMESERGRGAQSALFARRITDAADAGCRWVTAETLPEKPDRPNQSLRNMLRLGFEALYEREVHVHRTPALDMKSPVA